MPVWRWPLRPKDPTEKMGQILGRGKADTLQVDTWRGRFGRERGGGPFHGEGHRQLWRGLLNESLPVPLTLCRQALLVIEEKEVDWTGGRDQILFKITNWFWRGFGPFLQFSPPPSPQWRAAPKRPRHVSTCNVSAFPHLKICLIFSVEKTTLFGFNLPTHPLKTKILWNFKCWFFLILKDNLRLHKNCCEALTWCHYWIFTNRQFSYVFLRLVSPAVPLFSLRQKKFYYSWSRNCCLRLLASVSLDLVYFSDLNLVPISPSISQNKLQETLIIPKCGYCKVGSGQV